MSQTEINETNAICSKNYGPKPSNWYPFIKINQNNYICTIALPTPSSYLIM